MWTPGDVARLQKRVRRMAGERTPQRSERCEIEVPGYTARACAECAETNHAHAAVPVGPYRICRCLSCPTLVVTP